MAGMHEGKVKDTRAIWQRPKLQELGNLRDFVQAGNAYGKSGAPADGSSDPGGESMTMG